MRLDSLKIGQQARVVSIAGKDRSMEAKLREIGFAENDLVEMMQTGPFGRSLLCVRLSQTLIALRRGEAALINVEAVS